MRKFENAPTVLLQDQVRKCAYLVPGDVLEKYVVSEDTWSRITPETVVFSIPDPEIMSKIPPFLSGISKEPSFLIQHPRRKTGYFLEFADVQEFKVPQPTEYGGYDVSFVIPTASRYLEDVSIQGPGQLQSGEAGMTDIRDTD